MGATLRNPVVVDRAGTSNIGTVGQFLTTARAVSVSQLGEQSSASFDQNNFDDNYLTASQVGNLNNTTAFQRGISHSATVSQSHDFRFLSYSQTGTSNSITSTQKGTTNFGGLIQGGSMNTVNTVQNGTLDTFLVT
ncbi:hypothetical protein [Microbulbifer okhotskensis]|uniref:hypothetical protein n=1 Tax=Microbulbifer okhotskensis TaxID=2926617 RepID=UPI00359C5D44